MERRGYNRLIAYASAALLGLGGCSTLNSSRTETVAEQETDFIIYSLDSNIPGRKIPLKITFDDGVRDDIQNGVVIYDLSKGVNPVTHIESNSFLEEAYRSADLDGDFHLSGEERLRFLEKVNEISKRTIPEEFRMTYQERVVGSKK